MFFCVGAYSQNSQWPAIPGISKGENVNITLLNQNSFIGLASAAVISYGLAEFVLKDVEDLNYYQVRSGVFGTLGGTVVLENFGVEKRVRPWFGLGVEINNQQWFYQNKIGAGMGLNTYYRWHIFGKKKFSPYLEYGAGLFFGFSEFPPNGTNFTFNLTTQLGAEYTLSSNNKLRLSYGHIHQSNNYLFEPNPGEDGNGFNISYLWFWK